MLSDIIIENIEYDLSLQQRINIKNMYDDGDDFYIRRIEGLDGIKASIDTTPLSGMIGDYYLGSHLPKRNIVMDIAYGRYPGRPSITELRKKLYDTLITGSKVSLSFKVSFTNYRLYIEGYVESVESDIFSKDTYVRISLICPTPYFQTSEPIIGTVGSSASISTSLIFVNEGNAPIGVDVVRIPVAATSTTINFGLNGRTVYINRPVGFRDAGVIFINTMHGLRDVIFRSGSDGTGPVVNAIPYLRLPVEWPVVIPGSNRISFSRGAAASGPVTFEYRHAFTGL